MVDNADARRSRQREGAALAKTLIGMARNDAVGCITAAGFQPQVITPDVAAITADLSSNRVRIWVDEVDVVTRAFAG